MIYSFIRKTGLPSNIISEERIQLAKQTNVEEILESIKESGTLYSGTYSVTVEHEMKFKKRFDYHLIKTTIYVDDGIDEELDESEEEDDIEVEDE